MRPVRAAHRGACGLKRWSQKAEAALDGALQERDTDAVDGELATAMQRIGELSMGNELLRSSYRAPCPFDSQEVAVIAAETSPSTGGLHGIAQVCRIQRCRGRPSMATMPTGAGPTGRHLFRHSVSDRSPWCPTTPCWRRSAPISPARPGTAREIARCGRGCG